ncbi:hypothetical protein [Bradyrhizobium sp.]|uniref:hypothetical protein n=2 Tax=Bradyrhizobium TaxID=374 RepID=UPI0003A45A02|nr:MAG: hypothetical protein EKK32_30795 [Bradyrhizobiaceae bacterium]
MLLALVALNRDDLYIITSARTSEFDLRSGEMRKVFDNNLEHFSVDELDNKEISDLIAFMDNYALWGSRQVLSSEKKMQFIRTDCSRELRSVILETLDSPNIRERIQHILSFDHDPQDRIKSTILTSQLLNLAQIRPDLSILSELLGFDARKSVLEHESKLRDFSLIQNGRITIRSSIFAEYLLKKLIDTAFVIDVMFRCMIRLDSIFSSDELYRDIYKNFSRFRFVEFAIAVEKRRVHMIRYFENLKELSHCRENSLFWLQYAMCRLSLQQYPEAARLFDVAFAFSKKHGYRENRHLNNQYARFLLESRTNSNEYTDYMAAFNKAHSICVKQMHDEPQAQNPYRQAALYYEFIDRRVAQLASGDLLSIFRSCGEVSTFVAKRRSNKTISDAPIVEECGKAMQRATARIRAKLATEGVHV